MRVKTIVLLTLIFFGSMTRVYAQCSFKKMSTEAGVHLQTEASCDKQEVIASLCRSPANIGQFIWLNDAPAFELKSSTCLSVSAALIQLVPTPPQKASPHRYRIQFWAGVHMPDANQFRCIGVRVNMAKVKDKFFLLSDAGTFADLKRQLEQIKAKCDIKDAWLRPDEQSWASSIQALNRRAH